MSKGLKALSEYRKQQQGVNVYADELLDIIEKELIALEIIKEKKVNVDHLCLCITISNNPLGAYNKSILRGSKLEPSEYESLKEVLL